MMVHHIQRLIQRKVLYRYSKIRHYILPVNILYSDMIVITIEDAIKEISQYIE